MDEEHVYKEHELYPGRLAHILSDAGLIYEEDADNIEAYLWQTATAEVN